MRHLRHLIIGDSAHGDLKQNVAPLRASVTASPFRCVA
ncbi:hypothetical protein ACZ87_03982 [Candidatus Erwinia dacicola]|uniref:Uncharacterized protein n=1 Tax=Candidatus Erwinia dacicola TaxID=252393 RepID=A0A328T954_9GAMM|nr:hypothetical protein ACZ87_03982 [Candidatus Erwinia dacicola]